MCPRVLVVVVMVTLGCTRPATRAADDPSLAEDNTAPTEDLDEPPSCCADYDELRRLDGQKIRFQGTYQKTHVAKRARPDDEPVDLDAPGNAQVVGDGVALMLGVYYRASGVRDAEEIRRLHGKQVIVVGIVHARAPDMIGEDGVPMQTMTNPYIDVETIVIAP